MVCIHIHTHTHITWLITMVPNQHIHRFGSLGMIERPLSRSLQNFSLRSAADCWAYRGPHGLPGRCRWLLVERKPEKTGKRRYEEFLPNKTWVFWGDFWIFKLEPPISAPTCPSSTCFQPALPISHPCVPDRLVCWIKSPDENLQFWDHKIIPFLEGRDLEILQSG